jgi:hypothetical protein
LKIAHVLGHLPRALKRPATCWEDEAARFPRGHRAVWATLRPGLESMSAIA